MSNNFERSWIEWTPDSTNNRPGFQPSKASFGYETKESFSILKIWYLKILNLIII